MISGFPNLFMIHGPGSPGVLAQMITGGEWQVDWVTGVIEDLDRRGVARIDATPEAEQGWAAEMEEMAAKTLYRYADSWYVGANIPGKPRNFMIYIGGFNTYTATVRRPGPPGLRRLRAHPGGRPGCAVTSTRRAGRCAPRWPRRRC